jgi:hypothetical protein
MQCQLLSHVNDTFCQFDVATVFLNEELSDDGIVYIQQSTSCKEDCEETNL